MNIRKFLKWSLVLMALLAYKHLEGSNEGHRQVVYTSTQQGSH